MPQNLRRLLKIKELEKKIKTKNVEDLAYFDENVFKILQFSQTQIYLKCIWENAPILPTVKLNKTKASDKTEKTNLFNTYFSSLLNENTEISCYRLTLQSKISILGARLHQLQLKHPK